MFLCGVYVPSCDREIIERTFSFKVAGSAAQDAQSDLFIGQDWNEAGRKCGKFVAKLNEVSIATRYPEDVEKLQKIFTDIVTKQIISQTKETLEWINKQF